MPHKYYRIVLPASIGVFVVAYLGVNWVLIKIEQNNYEKQVREAEIKKI